jgi:hypothetical protein
MKLAADRMSAPERLDRLPRSVPLRVHAHVAQRAAGGGEQSPCGVLQGWANLPS